MSYLAFAFGVAFRYFDYSSTVGYYLYLVSNVIGFCMLMWTLNKIINLHIEFARETAHEHIVATHIEEGDSSKISSTDTLVNSSHRILNSDALPNKR